MLALMDAIYYISFMLDATFIRIYPTCQQKNLLAIQFGCARWVWNNAHALCQDVYKRTGKRLSYHDLATRLPKLKIEFEWLTKADSQILQSSLRNLARAYENFFTRRSRFPLFKKKQGRQSVQYPQRVKIKNNRIYLPKIGWVKCVVHREIFGKFRTVTVSQNACGQFHASVLTENDLTLPNTSTEGKSVGIDLGLTHLATTSDGLKIDNPRHIRTAVYNLKRKQRALARKQKGSKNRDKARKLVARAHEHVSCARKDFLHKLSRQIINENQIIVVENLHVKGILKNHNLAQAVSDVGWSTLVRYLEYKALRSGKALIKCDRWFPSSKTCSECGVIQDQLPLSIRTWECSHCGVCHDRDLNAAKNIKNEGLRILAGGVPATASGDRVRRSGTSNPSNVQRSAKLEICG